MNSERRHRDGIVMAKKRAESLSRRCRQEKAKRKQVFHGSAHAAAIGGGSLLDLSRQMRVQPECHRNPRGRFALVDSHRSLHDELRPSIQEGTTKVGSEPALKIALRHACASDPSGVQACATKPRRDLCSHRVPVRAPPIMPIRWTPVDRLSASALSGLLLGWGIAEALLLLTG